MAKTVDLDALIPREDFEIQTVVQDSTRIERISIRDLESSAFFYMALCKPDFQRETARWTPKKVVDLVTTFLNGDLVPAVILWQSGKDVFVIDGAHRLSALIAWVQNDYGDGPASIDFSKNNISDEQKRIANDTRKLIASTIGSYAEHKSVAQFPESGTPAIHERAQRLATLALPIQWVPGRDASKAEASFFKINQAATPIDPTELRILKSRAAPNALAARAIVRAGTGHTYWRRFSDAIQGEIEAVGKEIYETLYQPALDEPIKTLDLPVAGRGYSAQTLPLVFDLVNLANDVKTADSTAKKKMIESVLSADTTGQETIAYLKKVKKLVFRISGTHPSSLGLHPALYFYGPSGAYQPAAFLGIASLFLEFEAKNKFQKFSVARKELEGFFLRHKGFVAAIVSRFGSGIRSVPNVKALFEYVVDQISAGKKGDELEAAVKSNIEYSYLWTREAEHVSRGQPGGKFSRETKSAAFLRQALENPLRCPVCGGLMHKNSMQADHIDKRREGGSSSVDNARITHPYCNSTLEQ